LGKESEWFNSVVDGAFIVVEPFEAVSGKNASMVLYPFLPWPATTRQGRLSSSPGCVSFAGIVTARFQTFGQPFGTSEHAHRLATDIHLEEERFSLTGLHAIDLRDDRMDRTSFGGGCGARLAEEQWGFALEPDQSPCNASELREAVG
jgi:hypothetical protein